MWGGPDTMKASQLTSRCWAGAALAKGPTMQLYGEGKLQGITVDAIPGLVRPEKLDGTMVSPSPVASHSCCEAYRWRSCSFVR